MRQKIHKNQSRIKGPCSCGEDSEYICRDCNDELCEACREKHKCYEPDPRDLADHQRALDKRFNGKMPQERYYATKRPSGRFLKPGNKHNGRGDYELT